MIVDAFIRNWVTVVMPTEAGTGGLGLTTIELAAYFYADDGLVESTQQERLQKTFYVLTGFFDRVGLMKNMAKTVGMLCQPYHAPGGMLEEAYVQRTTGKGPTFWDIHQRQVECPECRVKVSAGSPLTNPQSQNDMVRGDWGTPPPHTTPQGGPYLPGILNKTLVAAPMSGIGVPGWGVESD